MIVIGENGRAGGTIIVSRNAGRDANSQKDATTNRVIARKMNRGVNEGAVGDVAGVVEVAGGAMRKVEAKAVAESRAVAANRAKVDLVVTSIEAHAANGVIERDAIAIETAATNPMLNEIEKRNRNIRSITTPRMSPIFMKLSMSPLR